jgi:hypothetical protein
MKDKATALDTPQHNWAAMFTAFASGTSLEEIAEVFACPMPVLRRVATTQDWAAIASRLNAPVPLEAKPDTEGRLAVIEANRRKNYEMADILRDRLMHDFTALRQGTLRVDRALSTREGIVHVDVEPGPQDMVSLANAAKAVAEMTYRALGDGAADDRSSSRVSDAGAITVILPTVVHHTDTKPRNATPVEVVVDLRPKAQLIDAVVQTDRKKSHVEHAMDSDDIPEI